jgi:hypothetical protein
LDLVTQFLKLGQRNQSQATARVAAVRIAKGQEEEEEEAAEVQEEAAQEETEEVRQEMAAVTDQNRYHELKRPTPSNFPCESPRKPGRNGS